MNKFGKEKIATLLACATVLGGKAPCSQTVEAAGRSAKSSGEKFVNWVKNHKWQLGVGIGATAAAVVVSTVLGVKYLGKKDQEKPGEQENKDDGKGKKDLGEKKKKSKEELKDFKRNLKVKVGEWLNDPNKRKQELALSTKEKTGNLFSIFGIFRGNEEKDIDEEEIIDVLSVLYNALSDEKQLKSVEEASSDGVFLRLDGCHFLCKFKDDDHRYVLEFYKDDYKTTLWFRTAVT